MIKAIFVAALLVTCLTGCAGVRPPALPENQVQFDLLVESWAGSGRALAASRTDLQERGFECRDLGPGKTYCEHYRPSPSGGRLPVVHGIEIDSRDGTITSNRSSVSRTRRLE